MNTPKILIVDDTISSSQYLKNLLRGKGYAMITTARTGEEAISMIKETAPDLILMDIILEGNLDGIDTAKRINAYYDIPIIYITAGTDETNLARAKETNPYGYIIKPVNEYELYPVIETTLYRRGMEKRLNEKNQEIKNLVMSINSILIGVSMKDTITHWSREAEKIFGIKSDEAAGRKITDISIKWDSESIYAGIAACIINDRPVNLNDIIYTTADGVKRLLGFTVSKVTDAAGGLAGFLIIGKDITEKRNFENQLIQASKMATVGEMATGVAHELNQPLNIIKMAAQRIVDSITEKYYTETFLKERSEKIIGQVDRASVIINHLKTFGRNDEFSLKVIDLNQPVIHAFDMLGEQLKIHNISAAIRLADSLPSIKGDSQKLEQVFINLIVNSRDAFDEIAESGRAREISVISYKEDDFICVEFSDNGPGIPENIVSRIFDPFFTTKDVGKGTGLGLSISHSIIKSHGGTINLILRNSGAAFIIKIPAAACS